MMLYALQARLTRLSDREAAASMQAILQAAPQLMQVAGDLLVKNLDWPGLTDSLNV